MPAFEYTALTASGKQEKGVLEGDTAKAVRQLLRDQKLTPLEVTETNKNTHEKTKTPFSIRKIGTNDLALVTRQLATLTKSGSTLEEALATTAKQTHKNFIKSIILSIRAKVVEGHTLAHALKDHPRSFSDLYQATVAAGEESGNLDDVLEELADYLESRDEFNQVIIEATIYPVIIVFVAVCVLTFLLTYIVPVMTTVFENNNQELPGLTQMVIACSDFVKQYGIYAAIVMIAGLLSFRALLKRDPKRRKLFHQFLLNLVVLGNLIKGINAARFTRTLNILVASGVPILSAMHIAGQVIGNLPIRGAIEHAAQRVREGTAIHKALEPSGFFPFVTLQLIASGESSGNLEEMLLRAALNQERQTSRFVKKFIALLSPMAVLAMGLLVLVIVLAIMLPIMNLNNLVA